jgi:hypothetical protein
MLSQELESRMAKIIEKLDKLVITEKNPVIDEIPPECEKYEYIVQKNAQKRLSTNFENISDFFNPEKEDDEDESQNCQTSLALNMKKLITIGEFQIGLEKLLEILEKSLNNTNEDKNYLDIYVNDISIVNDTVTMDDATKIKKFGEALVKKYHKISLLLKRYIRENSIVNDLILKEKKKGEIKRAINGRKRRSLFENIPLMGENGYKAIKGYPNLNNTFLKEIFEDIKKKKRISCVNIRNEDKKEKEEDINSINSSSESEEEDEEIEENKEKTPSYRTGKLRSSFMFL